MGATTRIARPGLLLAAAFCLAGAASAEPPAPAPKSVGLSGDWGGLRTRLAARGISPYASYETGFWANLSGGIETGVRYEGFADWGIELDLDRLAGWSGARFHLGWHSYHGGNPSQHLVGQFPTDAVSGWESAVSVRFYDIYLEQTLLDGALRIKAGQISADDDFFVSRYGSVLLNAAFAFFGSGRGQQDVPFYPLAGPGLYVRGDPSEHWTLRWGVYTADPGQDESSNFGFGWSLDRGASFLGEVTAHRRPLGLPGTYTLGLAGTTTSLISFRTGKNVDGSWGLYGMVDQALLLDARGEPKLGVFLRAGYAPEKQIATLGAYGNAGLVLTGPLPGREQDALTFGASYTKFADDYLTSTREAGQHVTGHEAVLELGYRAALAPWLSLQPDFQVILDPHYSRRDAFVLGLVATVTF